MAMDIAMDQVAIHTRKKQISKRGLELIGALSHYTRAMNEMVNEVVNEVVMEW